MNAPRPNFIVINVDNMGYGDAGCYGSADHDTPRLDAMAAEGIRFTDYYVTSGVCTPSRASLLTGCYAQRLSMHSDGAGGCVLFPVASRGLNPAETTIARLLAHGGYECGCIGKWHLGDQPDFLPTRHGFSSYFGIPYSEDMKHTRREGWPLLPLMRGEEVVEAPADLATITERYTNESIEFIRAHRDAPFFLYLAHATPGSERTAQVSRRFGGTSRNGAYGDSIHEIDWSTGAILDVLDELGLDDRTLVLFMSDNGAVEGHGGSNGPLGGWGYSTREGGMRVPCLVRWPRTIPAGKVCDTLVGSLDVLPTFAALAGIDPSEVIDRDHPIDGHDVTEALLHPQHAASPYDEPNRPFFYYQMEQLQAVRRGRWKLRLGLEAAIDHGRRNHGRIDRALFDVVSDPGETVDCAADHSDIVESLMIEAEWARAALGDTGRTGAEQRPPGEVAYPTARTR
jgi:arylsulfatase A